MASDLGSVVGEEVWESVNDKAASLAEAQTKLMEGPERADMEKLLNSIPSLVGKRVLQRSTRK